MKFFIRNKFISCIVALSLAVTAHAENPNEILKQYSVTDIRNDFTELYRQLKDSHYNLFARRSKNDYDIKYDATLAMLDKPMTGLDTQIAFQKFVAFGRVAHANITVPVDAFRNEMGNGGRYIPIGIKIVDSNVYVTYNSSNIVDVHIGDQIVEFNGNSMSTVLARLTENISADTDYLAYAQLESMFPILIWMESPQAKQYQFKIKNARGEVNNVFIPAMTWQEMAAASSRNPKSFQLDWEKREARMLDNGAAYLRPGPFYNNNPAAGNMWDTQAFSKFIEDSFDTFIKAGAKRLIIDLRDNPGGDNSFSDLMLSWFVTKPYRFASDFRIKVSKAAIESNQQRLKLAPANTESVSYRLAAAYKGRKIGEVFSYPIPLVKPRTGTRFSGKVFILINRHTFSNSTSVAALTQDYGFATILGEETADLATSYGAMEQFKLPRTGIVVNFPKALIIRPNHNMPANSVIPDIVIDTPLSLTTEDVVLNKAMQIAANRP